MKKALLNAIFILLPCLFLSNCNSSFSRIHKAYVPAPPSNFIYEEEQGVQLQTLVSPADLGVQFGKTVGGQLALSSNLLCGYTGQYSGEIGINYYKLVHPRHYLNCQLGIGLGIVDSKVERATEFFLEIFGFSDDLYSHDIETDYYKSFLQASYLFHHPNIDLGLALKFNGVYFSKYKFNYEISIDPAHQNLMDVNRESTEFRDKWGAVFEPSLFIKCLKRGRFALVMNFLGVFSTKIEKNWRDFGHPLLGRNERIYKHPFHHPGMFSIGMQLKLGHQ